MSATNAGTLKVGWGTADITPPRTAELFGQYYQRVAQSVRDPLSVTALAMEQPGNDRGHEQAIIISADQAMVDEGLMTTVRERLAKQVPDFDASRLIMSATHTHSAPAAYDSLMWWKHDPRFLTMEEFRVILLDGMVSAAVQAWKGRTDAQVGVGVGFASIGHCRRPVYLDGSSEMYGSTDRPDFMGMEADHDETVGVIGAWSDTGELTGLLVNTVCPSQCMEATYVVTADMFGEMRRQVRERLGRTIPIVAQIGAAGDQAPRDMTKPYRVGPRSGPTFWDEPGMVEMGTRLADAVMAALPRAEAGRQRGMLFRHVTRTLPLPHRMVSVQAYADAVADLAALKAREPADESAPGSAYVRFLEKTRAREKLPVAGPFDDKNDDFVLMRNLEAVVQRFQLQRKDPRHDTEIHVLRLGDTGIATSPFELYLEYGQRIRARSPAQQTFHTQLACGEAGYLPTARAVATGGYGALVANGLIGPEGGQMLVEEILKELGALFAD